MSVLKLSHPDPVLDRRTVVQRLIDHLSGRVYLEIGVELGQSLLPIRARSKIGVDPKPKIPIRDRLQILWHNQTSGQTIKLRRLTSDAFFAHDRATLRGEPVDVALVDGLHTDSQTYRDVLNCLEVLRPGGVIVVHDCNPATARIGRPAASHAEAIRLNPPDGDLRWSGDVWKTIVRLRSGHDDLRVFVLDADFGIGLVVRGPAEHPLSMTPAAIDALTYDDLDARRAELLDLRPASAFEPFLAGLRP